MSMSEPLEPDLPASGDGIPAADPGPGAPPTAPGFGVDGEEPDAVEPADGESSLEREPEA
jgi:hypothetical protein